jgi:hypothetical protein
MRHIVNRGLPNSTIFFHILSQTARISKKNYICNVFWFSLQLLSAITFILRTKKQDVIINVCCSSNNVTHCSCHILMILHISTKIFEKYSNTKFYENPSSGSRVVPYGETDGRTARQIYMTEPIVTFHNFANSSENSTIFSWCFIWEWSFVFHTEERKRTGSVWEQGASKIFGTKRKEGKGG